MGKRTVIWDIISAVFLILAILGYKWLILSGAYSFWAIACLFLLGIILGWDYFISRISALGRLTYDLRRFLIIEPPLNPYLSFRLYRQNKYIAPAGVFSQPLPIRG